MFLLFRTVGNKSELILSSIWNSYMCNYFLPRWLHTLWSLISKVIKVTFTLPLVRVTPSFNFLAQTLCRLAIKRLILPLARGLLNIGKIIKVFYWIRYVIDNIYYISQGLYSSLSNWTGMSKNNSANGLIILDDSWWTQPFWFFSIKLYSTTFGKMKF